MKMKKICTKSSLRDDVHDDSMMRTLHKIKKSGDGCIIRE